MAVRVCGAAYPANDQLSCLKPWGHDGTHAVCLGYHSEVDVWEWDEWEEADPGAMKELAGADAVREAL